MNARTAFNIPPFRCHVRFSKHLLWLSELTYGSAIIFVLMAPLGGFSQIILVGIIVCLAMRELHRQFSQIMSLNHSAAGWEVVYHQRLNATDGKGVFFDGKRCLLWPWLIILYAPFQRAVLIPKDSVSGEDFRRIQVRLRANPY